MPSKRVDVISLRMIRETSVLYAPRRISSPDDAVSLVKAFLEDSDRECMIAVYLNIKNEPTAIHTVSIGTLSTSPLHPREVLKAALLSNAATFILAHNHPSGDPTPSTDDIEVTRRMTDAGRLLGIELIDHVIIGSDERFISLRQQGQLPVNA